MLIVRLRVRIRLPAVVGLQSPGFEVKLLEKSIFRKSMHWRISRTDASWRRDHATKGETGKK